MDQVRSEGGRPQPSQTQTIVLTQAPLNGSAPGAICGGAVCPAPLFLEASAVETIMPASAFGGTQAGDGGWCPSLPPQAPPSAAQLAPIVPSVNAGASRKGGLATSQTKTSPDDSCNPNSVYKNFRRWQRFKALARRHLPQSPDAEALSCFLIPVLRSLSRLRPTMTLEEGMWRAMQEWQRKSNFDRMIYYEMAEKKALPSAQYIRRHQQPQETKSPNEIPPEAVREYMDIMDNLLGLPHSATEAPGGGWEDEEKEWLQDKDLLSYLDQLCSQEDFVTQVEAVIHPQFMEQIISQDAQQDPLALAEELEQEEGLTAAQLVEKRLLASKEGGVQAPSSHGAPLLNSSSSESEIGQDAQRHDRGPQLGVSDKACPPETDFKDQQRRGPADAHQSRPQASDISAGRQEHPPLWAQCPPSAPQGYGPAYCALGPREACIPREASLVRETLEPDRSSEDEEDLPSLAFLLGSPNSLLPCGLSLSPVPASGLACPGGRGPRGAAQSQFFQTLGLTRASPAASKSRKRALAGGPAHAEKTPCPGANLGICGMPALALELVCTSRPQKKKCDLAVTGKSNK
ncbi:Protein FAM22 [Myotis davidii]|uniref:Protein FAM22 n=1 Tax=Myotis davidii TaxID=225400 RepID=L5MHQ0_MYODS|nr:Protein FAM22 [Myotis davidii]